MIRTALVAIFATQLLAVSAHADFSKSTPALLEKGKKSFSINCTTCHGEKGDGNGPAGMALKPKPRNFIADAFKQGDKPEQVFKSITEGLKGTSMIGYKHLNDEERWALTHYVLSFRAKK